MTESVNKLPISVCLISGAEAGRIGKALESVSGWTSEIIVVLNEEVRDGTEEIALSHGAKVFREPWRGFIGQKNSAAARASHPWILGLDADEVVSPQLREEITRTMEAGIDPSVGAWQFPRCTFYFGRWIRHGDWYPDRVTRLWRKNDAQWTGIEPHAYLQVTGKILRLKRDLLHYSNQGIDQQISKIAPYSGDFVRHQLEQNKRSGAFELVLRPLWRFIRAYLFRLGFLDGWPGYYIAWLTAFSTLTRYMKVLEARQESSPK